MDIMLLIAVGGRQAAEALGRARQAGTVVFGTLDEPSLRRLDEERRRLGNPPVEVYCYESG